MTDVNFEIKILRQHWIKDDGFDDKSDLCSHGELYLRIGNEILSDVDSGSWCLSATGLYLLRTIKQDHCVGDFDNYLVPCCGHFMIPNEKTNCVMIYGCNTGIDWNIKHEKGMVELTTENGNRVVITFDYYVAQVIEFTDEIEKFYGDPSKKELPNDNFEQEGFRQFWIEWKKLRQDLI
ncbi:hypothetical protein D1J36_007935 [Riemerella anatipestifer]|uniref:hypothetical protein n=1 Tax=Riemerella anatipestifer TaxID=34085 RepID=UPI0012ADCAEA|nr:hypothetical protein [Riemerella anatipestifer]USL95202.1 hypothetical protein D1J36_007935 [Riemerella anatipestifer]